MVFFPFCKVNLGLDILRRREDGYHDIETVMLPVRGLCDILEIVPSASGGVEYSSSGLAVDCRTDDNLCVKAYRLMRGAYGIGGVKIHLHKIIPFGAGLGGGSADAAFTIRGLSQIFGLGLSVGEMGALAATLGSDTAFFAGEGAALSSGRGEVLEPLSIDAVRGMTLVIVKPPFGVSTAGAYGAVTPSVPGVSLKERIAGPVSRWRETLKNDFEKPLFGLHPRLAGIKEALYGMGAVYASLSGSGSALFGLFETPQSPRCGVVAGLPVDSPYSEILSDCFVYQEIIT